MLESDYETRMRMSREAWLQGLETLAVLPYSTPILLSEFWRRSISGTYKLLARLEGDGVVCCHRVEQLRMSVWTITRSGYHHLESAKPDHTWLYKSVRVNRVSPLTITHELMLQRVHLNTLRSGFASWIYGHSIGERLKKRPDAICCDRNNQRWAIEVERFPKSKSRVASIMAIYLQEIAEGRYYGVVYIAPTASLAGSLKRLFSSVTEVTIRGSKYPLVEKHYRKFSFFGVDGWPMEPER